MEDIVEYIAAENPDAAERMIEMIDSRCARVAEFPDSGTDRSNLSPGMRSITVGSYFVFYVRNRRNIEIVRVLHSARDIDSIFNPE